MVPRGERISIQAMSYFDNHRFQSAGKAALRVLRITLGVILVLLGLIGGLIPIFQGWMLGLPGLALLSVDVPFVRRWYNRIKERIHEHRNKQ